MGSAAVVDVANQFRAEFESTVENLRNRGKDLNQDIINLTEEIKTQLQTSQLQEEIQAEVTKAVQDMSPLEDPDTHKFLLETYLWTAICIFGMGLGQFLGTYIFRYFLGMVFSTWVTVLFAYLLIPLWFIMRESKTTQNEEERRITLLGVSLVLGILSGYNLADLTTTFISPPAFLLPLIIALTAGLMGPTLAKDRRVFLGATLGLAVFFYLIFGVITRSFRFPYLLWVMVSASAATVSLQIQVGKQQEGKCNMILAQFSTILSSLLINALLLRLFGKHKAKK